MNAPTGLVAHHLELLPGPPVLALGAWLGNTVCAAHGRQALLSHPLGDLDQVEACQAHEDATRALLTWMAEQGDSTAPAVIAHDLHPDFHSTRHAARLAVELGVPLLPVQHHHAHVAAVCAEHGHADPVIGLALDGTGLGDDGGAWGGELLRVTPGRSTRLGHLRPLSLPGGDRAAREPWRLAAAVLHTLGRGDEIEARFAAQPAAAGVARLLAHGLRCPPSSSLGRVFDAAAALLGLCELMTFDAEAPIALERAAARHGPGTVLAGGWRIGADLELDLLPLLASLADERDAGCGAARFHATLGAALADWVATAARRHGLDTVAAGGGCLCNRLLTADLQQRLGGTGLNLLLARRLPPGDGAIAFGQAVIARQRLQGE